MLIQLSGLIPNLSKRKPVSPLEPEERKKPKKSSSVKGRESESDKSSVFSSTSAPVLRMEEKPANETVGISDLVRSVDNLENFAMSTRRGLRSGSRTEENSVVEVDQENLVTDQEEAVDTTPIETIPPTTEALSTITEHQSLAFRKANPRPRDNSTPESDSEESPIRDPAGQDHSRSRPHFSASPIDDMALGTGTVNRRELNSLRSEMNEALVRIQKDVERITTKSQEALQNGLRAVHEHLRQSEERVYSSENESAGLVKDVRLEMEEIMKLQRRDQSVMEENITKLISEMSEDRKSTRLNSSHT